jgi:hypothetical protein
LKPKQRRLSTAFAAAGHPALRPDSLAQTWPGLLGNITEIESVEGESEMENLTALKGVQYLVDSSGERTAVVISLEEWGEIWEDFYDVLVSESRKDEPTVAWETLKAEMASEAPSNGNV